MPLSEHLDRLAAFEPTTLPVISLYLNTQPDQHGRANFESLEEVQKANSSYADPPMRKTAMAYVLRTRLREHNPPAAQQCEGMAGAVPPIICRTKSLKT
jgi:hypothetical protein